MQKSYYTYRHGVKLTMQELQELAYAPERLDGDIHAGAGAASASPQEEDSAGEERPGAADRPGEWEEEDR
jgi:hypothetical protein